MIHVRNINFKELEFIRILNIKNNESTPEHKLNIERSNTQNKNNFIIKSNSINKEQYKQSPGYMGMKFINYYLLLFPPLMSLEKWQKSYLLLF